MTNHKVVTYGGRDDLSDIVGALRSQGAIRLIWNHRPHHQGSSYSFVPYHVLAGSRPIAEQPERVVPHLCADDVSAALAGEAYRHLTETSSDRFLDLRIGDSTFLVHNPSIGRGVAIKVLKKAKSE